MKQNNKIVKDYRCLGTLTDQNLRRVEQTKVCLKLATLKYKICGDKCVYTQIKDQSGKEITVKIVNNYRDALFNMENCYEETIIKKMEHYVTKSFKLSDGLKEYKKSQQTDFIKQYFVKLFKIKEPDDIERENVGRTWIDFVEQIRDQLFHVKKYIFDTNNEYGIWASRENLARLLLNSKGSQKHYGKDYVLRIYFKNH